MITLGGALNSGVNNVVKQLNPEKQWGDIDWKTVGGQVIWGGSISLVGAGISTGIDKTSWVSELLDIMNINKNFARNVAGSTIKGMMVGGGTGVVAGAFRANVTKDWRDIFGGMLNGMAYGAGAGLASSLITEAGYQLQLKNSKSPAISADMAEVISSNTNDIVRRLTCHIWIIIIGILLRLVCLKITYSILMTFGVPTCHLHQHLMYLRQQ